MGDGMAGRASSLRGGSLESRVARCVSVVVVKNPLVVALTGAYFIGRSRYIMAGGAREGSS